MRVAVDYNGNIFMTGIVDKNIDNQTLKGLQDAMTVKFNNADDKHSGLSFSEGQYLKKLQTLYVSIPAELFMSSDHLSRPCRVGVLL